FKSAFPTQSLSQTDPAAKRARSTHSWSVTLRRNGRSDRDDRELGEVVTRRRVSDYREFWSTPWRALYEEAAIVATWLGRLQTRDFLHGSAQRVRWVFLRQPGWIVSRPVDRAAWLLRAANHAATPLGSAFFHCHRRDCRPIFLPRPNPVHFLHRQHEDFAIANFPGGGGSENRLHRRLHEVIGDSDLEPHFVVQLHLHRRPAIGLDLLGLAPVAADSADGEAGDFGAVKRFEHVVQFLRSYD